MGQAVLSKNSPATQIKELLTRDIQRFDRQALICKTQAEVIRFEIPVADLEPLGWLSQQTNPAKIFWSDRDGRFSMAGTGIAHDIKGEERVNHQFLFKQMWRRLSAAKPLLRYYGGLCFDPANYSSEWKDFGTYRFIIPRFEVTSAQGRNHFACNIAREEFKPALLKKILNELSQIHFSSSKNEPATFRLKGRRDSHARQAWKNLVQRNLQAIEKGILRKIVLARKTILEFSDKVPSLTLMKLLKENTPQCCHFYIQPNEKNSFLGASPERLFYREGTMLLTEALAGTRPRGASPKEDEKFKKELLQSRKDLLEHQLVVDAILATLQEVCTDVTVQERHSLLQLEEGHHLLTRIQGQLRPNINDATILFVLHPTPAVAGLPFEQALKIIKTEEPFSRGYYTGPVGWVGADNTEFTMAIRCGLIQGNHLSLYAGAGIVKGSSAQNEWNEIEQKLEIFKRILNL